MVLMLLRRHARARTLAVLLAAVVWGAAVDWGHGGWDDPACNASTPIGTSQSPRGFTASPANPASSATHCDLCHLLRLLHNALSLKAPQAGFATSVAAVGPTDSVVPTRLLSPHVSSRAPPRVHA